MDQIAGQTIGASLNEEERDRPFNPYRYAASDNTKGIIAEAIRLTMAVEERFALRKNKRRPFDQETFEETVEAVLSDLIYHHLMNRPGQTYVSRSNKVLGTKSRYRPRVYSKALPKVLDLLARPELDYVRLSAGTRSVYRSRKRTTMAPGARLLDRIDEHGVIYDDVGECPGRETLILKAPKDSDDYWDEAILQDYEETEQTERFRAELQEINQWLTQAPIGFDHLGFHDEHGDVDHRDRHLRRIFSQGSFSKGGRLFGGFWQGLSKHDRRERITIGSERAVELDYGQVGPRIVYGLAGLQPPPGDLYGLDFYLDQRAGIKKVMNAMLFAKARLARFPRGTRRMFRNGDRIDEVVEAIEAFHAPIRHLFHQGIGHEVQFVESQTMVQVLLTLKKAGVVALPVHDAVMVPETKASIAKEVMLSAFEAQANVPGIVTLEN